MIPRITQHPMPGYGQQPALGQPSPTGGGMMAQPMFDAPQTPRIPAGPAMNQLPGVDPGAPGTMAGLTRASPGMPANNSDQRTRLAMILSGMA